MALPPIVLATTSSAVLSATSNILAQAITAYRSDKQFTIDWIPVFQFFWFTVASTPPNFLWQEFLESTFPASKTVPSSEAVKSASGSNEKELDREAREGKLVETKLDVPNTIVKFTLDQTIGAAINTLLFSFFLHSIKQAMAHRTLTTDLSDIAFLTSGKAIDYSQVDWRLVLEQAKVEFYPIMKAGLSLWPMVSLFNFVVVKSIEGRNLVGSLAGVVWGIYMSLVAAG
ncbi:Mpv17/PMP22 family protein [Diaporthe helianthi]|uniref:Mpv17/PMP22 family protein n=1 Tax=Diaporthe helianthi TaxID=158607 RepID=A0A2P5I9B2_DIAHE|nr:Mpv17/PMP22 family protein [Diaporthe helianthi]